jgi:hypothetical protein
VAVITAMHAVTIAAIVVGFRSDHDVPTWEDMSPRETRARHTLNTKRVLSRTTIGTSEQVPNKKG